MSDIILLASHNALSSSISLPSEMLTAANDFAKAHGNPQLSVVTATASGKAVTTQAGFSVSGPALETLARPQLVYIPSTWRSPLPMLKELAPLRDCITQWYLEGTRFCSVSTGSYLLAEFGLLDHQPATTHWHYFDHFSSRYPHVELKRDYFVTVAKQSYCASSVNSLADLTVHLISELYNHETAHWVQRNFSHEIRRPFKEIAYIQGDSAHKDEEIALAQHWIRENLQHPEILNAIVQRLDMNPRTFSRRFRNAVQMTPNQFVQKCRIEQAKQLLRHSNLAIGDVSFNVGYQDVSFFAQLFRRQLGLSPSEYRRTVRAKLFIAR